jgi:hypothetical protein
MKMPGTIISFAFMAIYMSSCNHSPSGNKETASYHSSTDTELADFINKIKAVDNHAHPNTIDPNDKGSDALPLDGLGAIELPARVRPESKTWLDAAKALYRFTDTALNEKTIKVLMDTIANVKKRQGDKFPN